MKTSDLGRTELISLGRAIVTERLESIGCTVTPPNSLTGGKLDVQTLIPSTEWLNAAPPLKDRPNVGKRSEPEYGISLARSSLDKLERYGWDASADDCFR